MDSTRQPPHKNDDEVYENVSEQEEQLISASHKNTAPPGKTVLQDTSDDCLNLTDVNTLEYKLDDCKKGQDEKTDDRVFKTIALFILFLLLGLTAPLIGSTIVHFGILFSETTRSMSLSFTSVAVGILIGAWICGLLFDRINKEFAFSFSIIVASLAIMTVTFVGSLYSFFATTFLQGIAFGFMTAGSQSYIVGLWFAHRLKDPVVQGINAIWSVGAALGPFFIKPFLVELNDQHFFIDNSSSTTNNNNGNNSNNILFQTTIDYSTDYQIGENVTDNPFRTLTNGITEDQMNKIAHARYAYLTVGLCFSLATLPFGILYFRHRKQRLWLPKKQATSETSADPNVQTTISKPPMTSSSPNQKRFNITLLSLLVVFYYFATYVEHIPMSLMPTFLIKYLNWSVKDSTFLMTLFIGITCIGRFLGVPISAVLRPRTMLALNLIVVVIGYFLLLFVNLHPALVYIAAALAGIGISTTFSAMLLWMSETLEITGRVGSLVLIGSSIGMMTGPALAGQLMQKYNFMWMVYLLNIASWVHVILYIVTFVVIRRYQQQITAALNPSVHAKNACTACIVPE